MAWIRARETTSGTRWAVTVNRAGAKRVSKTFRLKSAAEAWARSQEDRIEGGGRVELRENLRVTVEQALDWYLAEVSPQLKSGSEVGRANALKRRLGSRPILGLTRTDLTKYREARLRDKATRTVRSATGEPASSAPLERTISPQTVKHELGLLSRSLGHAEDAHGIVFQGGIPRLDYRRGGQSRRHKLPPRRDRILTADELNKLLQAAASFKDGGQLLDALIFQMETGARQGEMLGLTWCNVAGARVSFVATKNDESRTIDLAPLRPHAAAVLARRHAANARGRVFHYGAASSFRNDWSKARRLSGIQGKFTNHDLRHFAATMAAEDLNGNLVRLQRFLGHKTPAMTMRYISEDLDLGLRGVFDRAVKDVLPGVR